MRLPEVPSPMQLTDAGSAPGVDGLVAYSRPARPRRRGSGLRRLLRASSSWRVGRSYRLTPCGGASLPCRQATTAPARRSRQAAAGALPLEASDGRGAGPVPATRTTPIIRPPPPPWQSSAVPTAPVPASASPHLTPVLD